EVRVDALGELMRTRLLRRCSSTWAPCSRRCRLLAKEHCCANQQRGKQNPRNLHCLCAEVVCAVSGWGATCGLSRAPVTSHREPPLESFKFARRSPSESFPLTS